MIRLAVWSPCNKFIAISPQSSGTVDVLDSATLQRLQALKIPREMSADYDALAFSPDSHMLTSSTSSRYHPDIGEFIISWDLQTGGAISVIERKGLFASVENTHITYSVNGKIVAILSQYGSSATISIYDVVSGVYMYNVDHHMHTNPDFTLAASYRYKIWTHGEMLRFITLKQMAITIWEVGFTSGATPMEVEIICIPGKYFELEGPMEIELVGFHPASCRLVFNGTRGGLLVWDTQTSKSLLHDTSTMFCAQMSFSSNGHFFACATVESEVYLWEESPTGYALFNKFTSATHLPVPYFSPDGKSIIATSRSVIQLWQTKTCTNPSSVLNQTLQHTHKDFILDFFPDRPLAVAAQKKDRRVMVLDLKSGVSKLTIDTSVEIYGLRQIENTIVIIGDKKVITWSLPEGNLPPGARMNVEDSTWTTNISNADHTTIAASISFDLQYVALIKYPPKKGENLVLSVYCTSTGQNLCTRVYGSELWIHPGGYDIWCATFNRAQVFTITQDALDCTKVITDIECGLWECPWRSSCSYKVTNEGWILGQEGNRLLMLPPLWQSHRVKRVWNGKFLALLHGGLPELVILELEP